MLTMRRVTKATELKRFRELEGKYHYLGENHSGGDTMHRVFRPVPSSPRKSKGGIGRTIEDTIDNA